MRGMHSFSVSRNKSTNIVILSIYLIKKEVAKLSPNDFVSLFFTLSKYVNARVFKCKSLAGKSEVVRL